ncbi:MAG: DUF1513 domain-containing protein [Bdellovibrionales bacterium]|nr:DUF1513 domain-containing protein [Bdellovibrionales bacterium]
MNAAKLKRREFLWALAGAGTLAGVGSALAWQFGFFTDGPPEDHEFYSSYGEWSSSNITQMDAATPSYVVFFRPRSLKQQHFQVPLRVHSGVQDPINKSFLVFITKWGDTICSFDRSQGRVLKQARAAAGRRFFGHGVWDPQANAFWVVENDDIANKGYLVLRNHQLEIVREIPSHGVYPHEVKMPESGVLQVCNTGDFKTQFGSMAWVSTADGRLLKNVSFKETLKTAGPSHFLRSRRRPEETFIGSITAAQDTPSVIWRMSGESSTRAIIAQEKDRALFTGEVVSWAESPASGLMMWTHAKAKAVFSVGVDQDEEAKVALPIYPHGMIDDGDNIFVTRKAHLIKWSNGEYEEVARGPKLERSKFGSHIVRIES